MPVYAVGYDWRQSNQKSGLLLRERIKEILTQEQAVNCVIATHSMGGFVTRAALKSDKDEGGDLETKVKGVIHVFQPITGAVVLYRRFFTGAVIAFLGGYDGSRFSVADILLSGILGKKPSEFSENMSSLQGPMELLPTAAYPPTAMVVGANSRNGAHRYQNYFLYEDFLRETPTYGKPLGLYSFYGFQPPIRKMLVEKILLSSAFHQWLDGKDYLSPYKHPNTYSISGIAKETDIGVKFDLSFNYEIQQLIRKEKQGIADGQPFPEPLPDPRNPQSHSLLRSIPDSAIPAENASDAVKIAFLNKVLPLLNENHLQELVKPLRVSDGDGTVPSYSSQAFFPDQNTFTAEGKGLKDAQLFNPRQHRQLVVSGIEHGEAYSKEVVRLQVQKLIIQMGNLQPIIDEQNEEERKQKEKERLENWGKGGWRKDI